MAIFNVTIDNTKVAATLTNYPLYVDLSDMPADFWSTVANGGGDIRVYASDGTTELAREVVTCDTATDTGQLHVKVPSVSSSVDTVIKIDVDGSRSDYAVSATYGRDNTWTQYEAVYHMKEDPSGTAPQMIDSTGNGYDLTTSGSMTSGDLITGTIGKAIDFDGSDDKMVSSINHGLITGSSSDNLWVSCIVDGFAQSGTDRWVSFGEYVGLFSFSSTSFGIQSKGDNSGDNVDSRVDTGTHHIFALFDAGTEYRGWMDGAQVFQKTITDTESQASPITVGDGYGAGAGANVNATLDEVRVSGNNLGADWANTQYSNQSSPSTFYVITAGSTGQVKVYDGTAFVAKPVKVWNGTAWVVKPLKRWDGSVWVSTPY